MLIYRANILITKTITMKRFITLAMAVMALGTATAQQDKGGITAEMMQ